MIKNVRLKLLACLLFLPLAACAATLEEGVDHGQPQEPRCGDLLAQAGHFPPGLEFMNCVYDGQAQVETLIATYRVKMSEAEPVEEYMVREFGLDPLRFACCGWWSYQKGVRHFLPGYQAMVSMASEESLYYPREEWWKMGWFYVSVSLFLEDP